MFDKETLTILGMLDNIGESSKANVVVDVEVDA